MIHKKLSCPKFLGLGFLSIAAMVAAEYLQTLTHFYGIPGEVLKLTAFLIYGVVIIGWGTAFKRKLQPGSVNLTVTFMILTAAAAVIMKTLIDFVPEGTRGSWTAEAVSALPAFIIPCLTWIFFVNVMKDERATLSKGQKVLLLWPLAAAVLILTEPFTGLMNIPVISGNPVIPLFGSLTFYIFGFASFERLLSIKKHELHSRYSGITFFLFIVAGLAPVWNSWAMAFDLPFLGETMLFVLGLHFIMLYSLSVTELLPIQKRDSVLLSHMQIPMLLYNGNLEPLGKSKSAPEISEPMFNYLAEKGKAVYGDWDLSFTGIENGYIVEPMIMKTENRLRNEWAELCKEATYLKETETDAFRKHAFDAVQTKETDENMSLLKQVVGVSGHQLDSIERITASFFTKSEEEQRMALHTMDLLGTFISCTAKLYTQESGFSSDMLASFIRRSGKGLLPLKTGFETDIESGVKLDREDVLICYSVFEEILEQTLPILEEIKVSLKDYPEVRTFQVDAGTFETFVAAPFSRQLTKLMEEKDDRIGFVNEPLEPGTHGINFILTYKKEV